jgi:CDP-diacylglycerol--glycerol-3-phosphate 3-phosphatidyltransferase
MIIIGDRLGVEINRLAALKREWRIVLVTGVAIWVIASLLLRPAWPGLEIARWSGLSGILIAYQLIYLWRNLARNHPQDAPESLYQTLGLGNWVTVLRAFFLALLAGFFLLPWPGGAAAWAPGIFYLSAAILDFIDGWAARVTRQTSALGELLDMHWDGFGVLVASILLVQYGQAPVWYLLVGLARYLFLIGLWMRARRGLPNHPLETSGVRRALAGVQMGFIAVILLPVFTPPATQIAASLFMLPLLIGFIRDWFVVCGVIRSETKQAPGMLRGLWVKAKQWAPLGIRAGVFVLLAITLAKQLLAPAPEIWVAVIAGAGLLLIGFGVLGRATALAIVLMSGFLLRESPVNWLNWAILFSSSILMLAGTGRYSLWKPEEWLITHRAGESGPYR